MNRLFDYIISYIGHRSIWMNHYKIKAMPNDLFSSITEIKKNAAHKENKYDNEKPIFILSAGWRSGSTLLQRMVCSENKTLLWGEPYGDMGLINDLCSPLRRFNQKYPSRNYFFKDCKKNEAIKNQWIANLYPSLESLRESYQAFFITLFKEPALISGATTWGLKEVRYDAEYAFFLKWLFPKAKIIFLVRNPLNAYSSYSKFKSWYKIRPITPIFTAKEFSKHWQLLAQSFLDHHVKLDAFVIKYEDLITKKSKRDELSNYLSLTLDESVLNVKIKSGQKETEEGYPFLKGEKRIVHRITSKTFNNYQY
jgi:hypothetical protein